MDNGWKDDRRYNLGDRIGPGKPLDAPLDRSVGAGTKADPQTTWIDGTFRGLNKASVEAHERICKEVAKIWGQSFCVIRGKAHGTERNIRNNLYVNTDLHITVFYGESSQNIHLQGHIAIIADARGVPIRVMKDDEMKHWHKDGPPRAVDLYGYKGSLGYDYKKHTPRDADWTPPKKSKMDRGNIANAQPKPAQKVQPVVDEDGFTQVTPKRSTRGYAPSLPTVQETGPQGGNAGTSEKVQYRPLNQQENVPPRGNGQPPRRGPNQPSTPQRPPRPTNQQGPARPEPQPRRHL